jgi:hypothetical protein
LARGVLRKHGAAALTYTEDSLNYLRIAEVLLQYREENHFNPSLERLFLLLLGDSDQQNVQLTSSSETEAEQEAKPKQRAKAKGAKRRQAESPDQRPGKSYRKGLKAVVSQSPPLRNDPKFEPATFGGGSSSSVQSRQFPSASSTAKPAFKRLANSSAAVVLDIAEEDDLPLLPRKHLRNNNLQK